MKSLKEIRNELVELGATQRIVELDKERQILLRLINHDTELRKKVLKTVRRKTGFKFTKSNPHWTQKPENKAKLAAMVKKSARNRP